MVRTYGKLEYKLVSMPPAISIVRHLKLTQKLKCLLPTEYGRFEQEMT